MNYELEIRNYWLTRLRIWLIYLFFIILPFQTRLILRPGELNGYWEYGTISVYVVEMLLWLLIVLIIVEWLTQIRISNIKFLISKQIPNPKSQIKHQISSFRVLVSITGLVIFISSLRALSPSLSFYWLLHFVEGLAIFLVIRYSAVGWRRLSVAFISGAVIQAGLGIWQFATQSVFASKWLGMAIQNPSILGTSVVEAAGGRFLRAYGSLPHPNILGAYLLIAVILLFYCFIAFRNTGVPAKAGRYLALARTPVKFYILHSTFYILIIGIFFSFSRAAWLGLLLTIVFIMYAAYKSYAKLLDRAVLRNFYILPVVAVVIFIVLSLTFWPLTQTRLMGGERLEIKSNIERISGYQEAWQIIKDHPWFGVGPSNYTLAVHNEIDSTRPSWVYQPVHNVYLLALAELGIFGSTAIIAFTALWLIKLWRGKQKVASLLIMTFFFFFLFDHFFWSLPFGIWLFWAIMGLASKSDFGINPEV